MTTILKTSKEMMEARGYLHRKSNHSTVFLEGYRLVKGNEKDHVYFFYVDVINKDFFVNVLKFLLTHKINHVILIYTVKITATPNSIIKKIKKMNIELFYSKELGYNVTKHELVPKHTKLKKKEAIAFKKTFKKSNIGKIKPCDAIYRFYGYSPGDIIRIKRVFNGETSFYYRIATST
jgi:DNA-directed RNA polymerase I, II, and III subunit RPABC1